MNRFYFILVIFLPFICSAQQTFTMNQGEVKLAGYFTEISYESIKEKIIVKAKIEEKMYRFIVDTGAPTMITKALFDKLQLIAVKKIAVNDANSKVDSLTVTNLREIVLGNIVFNDIPALVVNDPLIFDCHKVDGFIGSNLLRNSIVRISSRERKITLTDQVELLKLNKKRSADLVLNKAQSSPYVDIRISGTKSATVKVLFDTGMQGLFNIALKHYALLERGKIFTVLAQGQGNSTMSLNGLGNDTLQYRLRLPKLHINGVLLTNATIKTTANESSRIGAELLNYGILTLDYKNKKFYFDPYEASINLAKEEFPVSVTFKDRKMVIGIVWEKDLMDKIKINDQVLAVDDKDYTHLDPCELVVGNSIFEGKNKVKLTIKNSAGVISHVELVKKF